MNLHFLGKSFSLGKNVLKNSFYKSSIKSLKYRNFNDFSKNNFFKNNYNLKKSNQNFSHEKIPRKNTHEKINIRSNIFTKKSDLRHNKQNNNREYINTEISDSLDNDNNNNIRLDEINNFFKSKQKENLFDYPKEKNCKDVSKKLEFNENNINNSNDNISNKNSQRVTTAENDLGNIIIENSEKSNTNYDSSRNKKKDLISQVFTFKQKENDGNNEKINLKANGFITKNYNNINTININTSNSLYNDNTMKNRFLINNYLNQNNNISIFDKLKNKLNIEDYKSPKDYLKSNVIFTYDYKKNSFHNFFNNYSKRSKSLNIIVEATKKKYDNIMPVNNHFKGISTIDFKEVLCNYKSKASNNLYYENQNISNEIKSKIEGVLLETNSMEYTNDNNSTFRNKYGFRRVITSVRPANCFYSVDNKKLPKFLI